MRRWLPICWLGRRCRSRAWISTSSATASSVLFDGEEDPDLQRLAAASAVLRGTSIIAGGPGTGKTTTVARVLALIDEQASAAGLRPPLIALAAPTGKAAARLEEAVKQEAQRLPISAEQRGRLLGLQGQTLHRLLGWSPNHTRFRHHRLNRLAHDVVVVDETSMVSLSLMARLVEAVRPDGRLVLIGDPEQLSSVEAGAVLGDLVGPATAGLRMRESGARTLIRGHRPGVCGDPRPIPIRRSATASWCSGGSTASAVPSPTWPTPSGRATPMPPWRFSNRIGTRSTGSRSTSRRRRSCSATCEGQP